MENGKVEMPLSDFLEIMEEKEELNLYLKTTKSKLMKLLDVVFEGASLNYDKTELYFRINGLSEYLKVEERARYEERLKELQGKDEV